MYYNKIIKFQLNQMRSLIARKQRKSVVQYIRARARESNATLYAPLLNNSVYNKNWCRGPIPRTAAH